MAKPLLRRSANHSNKCISLKPKHFLPLDNLINRNEVVISDDRFFETAQAIEGDNEISNIHQIKPMSDLTIARAIHILSVVIWMGGVSFVTIVLIPMLRRSSFQQDQLTIFNIVENRFASIARIMVLLAGISGFYMTYKLEAWSRFSQLQFFWMHAMVFVWSLFFLALFVIEPFILRNHGRMVKDGHSITNLRKTQIVHSIILVLSLTTLVISVLGAHRFFY